MMKSYQLFRFYKYFYKSIRIKKQGKVGLCFITGCFKKPYKMIIIFSAMGHFVHKIFIFFASSFAAQFSLFDIRMTQEILKREIGNVKFLVIANYNIYFKNNFNQNVHIWLLININHRRSL